MTVLPHNLFSCTTVALMLIGLLCGCDPPSPDSPPKPPASAPQAWTHTGESGYSITLPGSWRPLEGKDRLDNGADLLVKNDDRLLMVIPVQVPEEIADAMPSLETFKRVSLAQLERDVESFEHVSEENIELDGTPAITISAHGTINALPSHYILTYTQHAGWRYQIVAWSHASRAQELAQELDGLLTTWEFAQPSPGQGAGQEPSGD
ncbi:MAG: hypothetical protein VYE40_18805 [Myxococcota bacterium]|jgi:hypothetical protein|nr:hypothetical protein [Myxococcota bacterium]